MELRPSEIKEDLLFKAKKLVSRNPKYKDRKDVGQLISKLSLEDFSGRAFPKGKSRGPSGNEGLMLMREFYVRQYPKKLKTDSEKFKYLRKLYQNKEIPVIIFLELSDVLKLKEEEYNYVLAQTHTGSVEFDLIKEVLFK